MKKSRFTEGQIIGLLKQAKVGLPMTEVYRQSKSRIYSGLPGNTEATRKDVAYPRNHANLPTCFFIN